MKILCVIPSRMGSTRLACKPLLDIKGKPMIQRVYENAKKCADVYEVVVATDHPEIVAVVEQCGGKAILTSPDIQTGSDRVAAAAEHYQDMDVVINLQGDEPFVRAEMITQLVSPYLRGELPEMTTLAYPLDMATNYSNPGVVKVITDHYDNAIYFSRAAIPFLRTEIAVPVYHHIGMYAFRRDFLRTYTQLSQTPLEKAESLEQLRAIEYGYKIRVCLTQYKTLEINTAEEYQRAQEYVCVDD